jgi:hypothetical protein
MGFWTFLYETHLTKDDGKNGSVIAFYLRCTVVSLLYAQLFTAYKKNVWLLSMRSDFSKPTVRHHSIHRNPKRVVLKKIMTFQAAHLQKNVTPSCDVGLYLRGVNSRKLQQ